MLMEPAWLTPVLVGGSMLEHRWTLAATWPCTQTHAMQPVQGLHRICATTRTVTDTANVACLCGLMVRRCYRFVLVVPPSVISATRSRSRLSRYFGYCTSGVHAEDCRTTGEIQFQLPQRPRQDPFVPAARHLKQGPLRMETRRTIPITYICPMRFHAHRQAIHLRPNRFSTLNFLPDGEEDPCCSALLR